MKTYNADKDFPFEHIFFSQPKSVGGGGYYINLNDSNNIPLCIQFPKCKSKSGIIRTKRQRYCDLVYDKEDCEPIIHWIENIEIKCKEFFDKKKHLWFNDDVTIDDIENMLNPMYRLYKSGKNISIRCNIDYDKKNEENNLSIFDESGKQVSNHDTLEDVYFIPLIQLNGIKFSSKIIEIELKLIQSLIIDTRNNKCLILRNNLQQEPEIQEPEIQEPEIQEPEIQESEIQESEIQESEIQEPEIQEPEIQEITFDISNIKEKEEIILNKRETIYETIYKNAKMKAEQLKEDALNAYLELKEIKIKYNFDSDEE